MRIGDSDFSAVRKNLGVRQATGQSGLSIENGFGARKTEGKYDTLILSGMDKRMQEVNEKLRAEQEERISLLKDMTPDEVKEAVEKAYETMQSCIYNSIKTERKNREEFHRLQAQKSQYAEALNGEGSVAQWEGKAVSRQDLEKGLAEVQKRIDCLVSPPPQDPILHAYSRMAYQEAAMTFGILTGNWTATDCLQVEFDQRLMDYPTDRTEENYLQKSERTEQSLRSRSKGLQYLKDEFFKKYDKFLADYHKLKEAIFEGGIHAIEKKDVLEMIKKLTKEGVISSDREELLDGILAEVRKWEREQHKKIMAGLGVV